MIQWSQDPRVAEQQMNAVMYYLTAFGHVDGQYDASERAFIRQHVEKLAKARVAEVLGPEAPAHADVAARWTQHLLEVLEGIEHEIEGHFTESVADGERTQDYVIAKLKLRCFELFRGFDEASRHVLLETVDELMLADGVIDPAEKLFRDELFALLEAPIELDDSELEAIDRTAVVIGAPAHLAPREANHPFFGRFEHDYAKDPGVFARQAAADMELIERFTAVLAEKRARGAGRLAGAKDFSAFAGSEPFLDGWVHVAPPKPDRAYELLVVGDLHGCYSCLKAALMQADFFGKVQAYLDDPVRNPNMYLVFLGDYIDRGRYSYEGVLRTVMQLFVSAPDHVFVLRGNHEHYVEINGRVLAPVRPSEAMTSLAGKAPAEMLAAYMRLFELIPNTLVFDRTLFVHAGIPREDTLAERFHGIASLNDPELRFQMCWSDPSEADRIPLELQKANARFPFGRAQFKAFMARLGCTTMIRGHERIVEGFRAIYDEPEAVLLSLFSSGGRTNADLPETSNYREVTPMALTIRHAGGVSQMTPFVLDYERYNDPLLNAFFR